MACGCIVFSGNHALSDILTPGEIGHQIGCGSLSNDVDRITAALLNPSAWKPLRSKLDLVLEDLWKITLNAGKMFLARLIDFRYFLTNLTQ